MQQEFVLDGREINSLDDFFVQIAALLTPGAEWEPTFEGLDDMLRGGFGTPDQGFTLRWRYSVLSQVNMGPVFDTLVNIIRNHGPGGDESHDYVLLILE